MSALQFYRSVGGVLGLAVLGVMLATRFSSSLAVAGPDSAALAQELLDALGVALREALESVFVVAFIAAALSLGCAWFFRVTVRPELAPGDANDIDGEHGEQQP